MATHSSVLAWRIPGTGEPGGLLSMGSHRVRHDWSDLAAAAAAAMNMAVHVSLLILVSSVCMPSSGLLGRMPRPHLIDPSCSFYESDQKLPFCVTFPFIPSARESPVQTASHLEWDLTACVSRGSLLTAMEQVRRGHSESPGLVLHPHRPAGWVLHKLQVLSSLCTAMLTDAPCTQNSYLCLLKIIISLRYIN